MKTRPASSTSIRIGIAFGDRRYAVCVLAAKTRTIKIESEADMRGSVSRTVGGRG